MARALAHRRSRRLRRKVGAGLAPRAAAVVDFRQQQAGQGDVDLLRWAEIPFHRHFDHRPNPAGEVWIGSVGILGRTLNALRRSAGFFQFLDQFHTISGSYYSHQRHPSNTVTTPNTPTPTGKANPNRRKIFPVILGVQPSFQEATAPDSVLPPYTPQPLAFARAGDVQHSNVVDPWMTLVLCHTSNLG